MKYVAVLLIAAISTNTVFAEDPVYFADPNLKAAVEGELGITNPNETDMLGLTYLDARQRGIVDLTGLEHATNLTSLDLHNNQISNLSELSEMTMLTTLLLHRNQISDLWPLANLTNMTTITLQHNQITDTSPLLALTGLTFLSLEFNQVDNLSGLSGMSMLTTLPLHRNQISDLSPLANLTNLTSITLQHNQITNTSPLLALTDLTFLDLHNNQVDNLSGLSVMTMLTTLALHRNQISDLSPLANLTNLTSITLQNNQISDISPLSVMNSLTSLYLYNNPLDCPAYDIYIPIIETNNPGIYITYNPRPAYCDYQPDIDVSLLVYDFGDVELETANSILITILNYGNGDLSVQNLTFTPESITDFTVTLSPELPSIVAPEGSIDIEISFAPSTKELLSAVLEISSDDPDEPVVSVNLIGIGVIIEVPPAEQIEDILEFFDTSVADGTLEGVGPGNHPVNRLKALRNMLEATSDLIVGEYFDDAYAQLIDVLKKCDNQVPPPDFVTGEAREELANMILELMEDLESEEEL